MKLREIVGAAMVLGAMLVVAWLSFHGHEAATGALIGVVSAGVSWYLRGKVRDPNE